MLVGLRLGLCARDRNADCEAVVKLNPLLKALNGTDREATETFCVEFASEATGPEIAELFRNPILCGISGFIASHMAQAGYPGI